MAWRMSSNTPKRAVWVLCPGRKPAWREWSSRLVSRLPWSWLCTSRSRTLDSSGSCAIGRVSEGWSITFDCFFPAGGESCSNYGGVENVGDERESGVELALAWVWRGRRGLRLLKRIFEGLRRPRLEKGLRQEGILRGEVMDWLAMSSKSWSVMRGWRLTVEA